MKTWTEWIDVKEPNDNLSLPINKYQYEQIQLDAIKEGMTLAADEVGKHFQILSPTMVKHDILTARDNLKEIPG